MINVLRGTEVCVCWKGSLLLLILLGLVSRARPEGGPCLKTAAAVVESGDLSVVVRTIWDGDDSDRERLIQKV